MNLDNHSRADDLETVADAQPFLPNLAKSTLSVLAPFLALILVWFAFAGAD